MTDAASQGENTGNDAGTNTNTNQNDAPIWSSIEDEGVRGLMETKSYDSYPKLATAYSHLNKLVKGSSDVIALPEKDDDPEWGKVWQRLGAPDSPDGYSFDLGEDVEVDEDFAGWAKGTFHKLNLPAKAAGALAKEWQGYVTARTAEEAEKAQRADEAAMAEINKKYGAQKDMVVAKGQNAIKALGLSEEAIDKIETNIGAPAVVELLATLGEKIGKEDVIVDGVDKDGFGISREQAIAEKARLQADSGFVNSLFDPKHPAHLTNKRRWDEVVAKSIQA